jgi:hypothetical protein
MIDTIYLAYLGQCVTDASANLTRTQEKESRIREKYRQAKEATGNAWQKQMALERCLAEATALKDRIDRVNGLPAKVQVLLQKVPLCWRPTDEADDTHVAITNADAWDLFHIAGIASLTPLGLSIRLTPLGEAHQLTLFGSEREEADIRSQVEELVKSVA